MAPTQTQARPRAQAKKPATRKAPTKRPAARKPSTKAVAPAPQPQAQEERRDEAVAAVVAAPRFSRPAVKLAIALVLMVVLGAGAGIGTWSAFSATTDNTGNSFQAGTVVIGDNDNGTAMLSLVNAKPGDADVSCIDVTYTGSLASSVRMFGTTGGSGLAQYLDLVVTRGSGAAGFNNCGGFSPDGTDYIGSGAGVVYSGTLEGFADSYASADVDPTTASPEVWTTGEAHTYRFSVTVQDNNAAQGLNASQSFTWEARNN